MSIDEQHASHGKLIAEYSESKSRLVALRSEARRFADAAAKLADFIYTAHPTAFREAVKDAKALALPEKMVQLLTGVALEAERLESIVEQLASLGIRFDDEQLRPFRDA